MRWYEGAFICVAVFSVFATPAPEAPPEPEPTKFGYTDEETRARVAELRARDTPYVPEAPIFGENGYGTVTIKQEAAAPTFRSNTPITVTPVYPCVQWDWADPAGQPVNQYYPCGDRRNHWWSNY